MIDAVDELATTVGGAEACRVLAVPLSVEEIKAYLNTSA
jgi:hypothetical protein